MSMSRHDQNLLVATVLVIAFGLLAMRLRPGLDAWRDSLSRLDGLRRNRAESRELIDMGPQWRAKYDEVREEMPVFEPGRQVDTYWMSEMDRLAREFNVSITRRKVGNETPTGDVFEFSTECEWEAPLDAFAKFLHAMQSAGAMLDVRELVIRTQERKKGYLRGSFVLHCAYMRGETEESEVPSPKSEVEESTTDEGAAPANDRATAPANDGGAAPEPPDSPVSPNGDTQP